MKKQRKFPKDVARFFNTSSEPSFFMGTHQIEKMKERSYIPVYNSGGTARKVVGEYGQITYK